MKHLFLSTLLVLLRCGILAAQAGTLDSTFGNNGVLFLEKDFPGTTDHNTLWEAMDPKEGVVAVQSVFLDSGFLMTKFRWDGSLHPNFGINGQVFVQMDSNILVEVLKVQADNKTLVAGWIRHLRAPHWGHEDVFLTRQLENGQLDNTFGNQGIVVIDIDTAARPTDLFCLPDGKILVTGTVIGVNNADVLLMRFLPNGTLDGAFGNGGIVTTDLSPSGYDIDWGLHVIAQADGKILVSGYNGWVKNAALIRYRADGTLDHTFGAGGIVLIKANIPQYHDLLLKNDQDILLVGTEGVCFIGGPPASVVMRQFTPDGHVDSSFAVNGAYQSHLGGCNVSFLDAAIQADGKIVVAGSWGDGSVVKGLLMRFQSDGRIDSTFGTDGVAFLGLDGCVTSLRQLRFLPGQKIMVLGVCAQDSLQRLFLARFGNDVVNTSQIPPAKGGFRIFPNPAADVFSIQFNHENPRPQARLRLLDAQGSVVFEKTGISNLETVQTAGFASGVYFLEVLDEGRRMMGKVLVVR